MFMTFDMMPGPTDQARTLQLAQHALWEQFYDALAAVDRSFTHEQRYAAPTVVKAREAYDASVVGLVSLLGPTAACHQVDCDLWECFHDVYKDDVGCRPGGGWSLEQVTNYLARRRAEQDKDEALAAADAAA